MCETRAEKIPGGSGVVAAVMIEIVQNCAVLGLYIWNCVVFHHRFKWWVIKEKPMFAVNSILFGIYLFISFIAIFFLFYAAVSNCTLKKRKSICTKWLIFRVLSFIVPLAFLFASGDKTLAVICAVVVLMWIASISMVASFVFNLSEAIDEANGETKPDGPGGIRRSRNGIVPVGPPKPKPQRNKSAAGIRPPGVLTEEHLKQLEEFQDYVRRTSWCSWSASEDGGLGSRSNSNSMTHGPGPYGRR